MRPEAVAIISLQMLSNGPEAVAILSFQMLSNGPEAVAILSFQMLSNGPEAVTIISFRYEVDQFHKSTNNMNKFERLSFEEPKSDLGM